MTFLRWKIINGRRYAYLVTGIRYASNKVRSNCKYLGKEGSFDEESLKIQLKKETEQKRKKRIHQKKLMKLMREREEKNNREVQKQIEKQKNNEENKEEIERIKKILFQEFKIISEF